jgi:hypothetical protein
MQKHKNEVGPTPDAGNQYKTTSPARKNHPLNTDSALVGNLLRTTTSPRPGRKNASGPTPKVGSQLKIAPNGKGTGSLAGQPLAHMKRPTTR